jgi:hypothetical protein
MANDDNMPAPMVAQARDLDADGQDEVILDNGRTRVVLAPAHGGRLREWTYRPDPPAPARNLFAAAAYESVDGAGGTALRIMMDAAQPGIGPGLGPAAPGGMIDHFVPLTAQFRAFAGGTGRELSDLPTGAYAPLLYDMASRWELAMQRESGLRAGRRVAPLTLTKKISLEPGSDDLAMHYRIENRSDKPMQVYFAVEFTFALDAAANKGHGGRGYYEIDSTREPGEQGFGARGAAPNVTALALVEPQPGVTVRLGWDRAATLWVCPAPAATHGDAVRGACIMPVWELRLAPADNWAVGLWGLITTGTPQPLPPGVIERIRRTEWDDEPWQRGR